MRRKGDYLTPVEVDVVRAGFAAGRRAADVAEEVGCALRSVSRRYADMQRAKPRPKAAHLPQRHYTSAFEPG